MKKIILFVFPLFFMVLFTGCSVDNNSAILNSETINEVIDDVIAEVPNILQVDDEGNTKINTDALSEYLSQDEATGLSEEEISGIKFMLEEEKLARDVYQKLYKKWNQAIFNNISESEETHKEAVRDLAGKYGIDISFYSDVVGEFTNTVLLGLYKNLVIQGESSLLEALKVGALIEEIDILDLEENLEKTDNGDISLVYENLLRGSRNHLRSFTGNMSRQGHDYEPQRLKASNYEEIINSENERGGSKQGDQGNGSSGGGRSRR